MGSTKTIFTQAEVDEIVKERTTECRLRLLANHMRVELKLMDDIAQLKAEVERLRAAQCAQPEAQVAGGHER